MSALLAAGIAAGGSLLTNALTNRQNRILAEQERDWQVKMWDKQNSYNAPIAQMGRLSEAGLNPHLVYEKGATSVAAPIGAPASSRDGAPDFATAVQVAQLAMQQKMNNAQIKNIQADTLQKREQALTEVYNRNKVIADTDAQNQLNIHNARMYPLLYEFQDFSNFEQQHLWQLRRVGLALQNSQIREAIESSKIQRAVSQLMAGASVKEVLARERMTTLEANFLKDTYDLRKQIQEFDFEVTKSENPYLSLGNQKIASWLNIGRDILSVITGGIINGTAVGRTITAAKTAQTAANMVEVRRQEAANKANRQNYRRR